MKNAFDVELHCLGALNNLFDVSQQPNMIGTGVSKENKNSWVRTGEALGAGAKIYGFRVDNVHLQAYQVLGGLHRNGQGEEILEVIGMEEEEENNGQEGQ